MNRFDISPRPSLQETKNRQMNCILSANKSQARDASPTFASFGVSSILNSMFPKKKAPENSLCSQLNYREQVNKSQRNSCNNRKTFNYHPTIKTLVVSQTPTYNGKQFNIYEHKLQRKCMNSGSQEYRSQEIDKISPFEVFTPLPAAKNVSSFKENTSNKKQESKEPKHTFYMSLSRSMDSINRVRLYADSFCDTKLKAKVSTINLFQKQSKSFAYPKEQHKTKQSGSFSQKGKIRLVDTRYSNQSDLKISLKSERKDKAKELYDRLMGPQAGNYRDLETQIKSLMMLRREDRIGDLEFERKVKEIKFEALQRDREEKREKRKDCVNSIHKNIKQQKGNTKSILKSKIIPTSVIELNDCNNMQLPIKTENTQSQEECKDIQIKITTEEEFHNNQEFIRPSNDQINLESKEKTTRDRSASQLTRRGRAMRNSEMKNEENTKSNNKTSITNSRSTSDITKLVRLDLNSQIVRQHQYEIGCSEMLKDIQKLAEEEHLNRMNKPDDSNIKQITHRKFDYKFFMNCKKIQDRQTTRQSQMNCNKCKDKYFDKLDQRCITPIATNRERLNQNLNLLDIVTRKLILIILLFLIARAKRFTTLKFQNLQIIGTNPRHKTKLQLSLKFQKTMKFLLLHKAIVFALQPFQVLMGRKLQNIK